MGRRVLLTGGAYTARSVIADAQRCVNLYPEINPPPNSPPVPVTHYPTPGLTTVVSGLGSLTVRALYRASNGAVFTVVGTSVYRIDADLSVHLIGAIILNATTPVSMSDNGSIVVLVDGTSGGWWWDLATSTFNTISDAAFYGATRVQYLDGYFIFNRPGTNQFYVSPSFWDGVIPFDPTWIAAKTGTPDVVITISVIGGNLWLIGALGTEVYYNSGNPQFPFERQPGIFVDHGAAGPYSIAECDGQNFWLGRDRQGHCVAFAGRQYDAQRISTHAIEDALQSYSSVIDAIGFVYQQDGHTFYVLTLPSADRTWVYDMATGLWHERTWTDSGGVEHRIRANCFCFAYNLWLVGDWQAGTIYKMELSAGTDAGQAIVRRRGFPHLVRDGKRQIYTSFIADMAPGNSATSSTLNLRWSDDRGKTWGAAVPLTMPGGQYDQSLLWRRLGMARDRVFELYWSFPEQTALNGAWVEAETCAT